MFSFIASLVSGVWIMEHWKEILFVLVLLIICILIAHHNRKTAALCQKAAAAAPKPPVNPAPSALPVHGVSDVPDRLNGAPMVSHFDHVMMESVFNFQAATRCYGVPLTFVRENNAVVIFASGIPIGNLTRGETAQKILEWLDRGDPLYGLLKYCDLDTGSVSFGVFFYRNQAADPPQSGITYVPDTLRGAPLAYHYDNVYMDSPDLPAVLQSFDMPLTFRPEGSVIAIYAKERRLGCLTHSRLVDMIRDWLDRDDPLYGVLASYSEETGRVTFGLFFYREPLEQPGDEEDQSYRLTGNRGKEMQSNIDLCSEGDECTLDWDDEKEKYLVETNALPIGYLPASAARIVEESGVENCRVVIAEIGTDEQDKNVVTVHLLK